MKKLRYIIPVMLLALTACVKIDSNLQPVTTFSRVAPTEEDYVTVHFTVEMDNPIATKAMAHEPDIQTMRVAVFGSSGYLKEYTQATLDNVQELNYNGAPERKYNYTVKLNFSEKPRIVHFIANGPESLSFDSEDVVIANTLVNRPQDAYWQRIYLANGITAEQKWDPNTNSYVYTQLPDKSYKMSEQTLSDFTDIPMIRNFAEINITSSAANFELVSFALMNVPKSGSIAPYRGEDGFFTTKYLGTGDKAYEAYTYDTIKDDYAGWLPATAEIDTSVPKQNDNTVFTKTPKYVYERPSTATNPTWLIVAGKYGDSSSNPPITYYKVFLNGADGKNLTLYRNYKYSLNISEVTRAGQPTAEAAALGAGSGDISASVSANIASVSDGATTLTVQPATDWTFANGETSYSKIKFSFYGGGASNDNVTIETLSIGEAGEVIAGSAINSDSGISISSTDDEEGFRTLTFTTTATTAATKTQVIRITGTKTGGSTLYRDVTLNLISKQVLRLSLNPESDNPGEVEYGTGKKVVARLELPDNLPRSIFPLIMNIEPSPQCLNPEVKTSVSGANERMPVESGKSLADGTTNSYHFVKTITWEDYVAANKTSDNYHIIDADFTTVVALEPGKDKCTVYVTNEYFQDANAKLGVYDKRHFSGATMTVGEVNSEGLYPVLFGFNMDPNEYNNVKVTLKMKGVYPDLENTGGLTQVGDVTDGVRTYEFTATDVAQSFALLTSDPEDVISIEMSARHYVNETIDNTVRPTTLTVNTNSSTIAGNGNRTISSGDVQITFTSVRGRGTNYVILNDNSSISITAGGKTISSIVVNYYSDNGTVYYDGGYITSSPSGYSENNNHSVGTWTGSATTVSLSNGSPQNYYTVISSIVVTYK